MNLWRFAAATQIALALVFFSRQLHAKNGWFSAYLISASLLQLLFEFSVQAKFDCRRWLIATSLGQIHPWTVMSGALWTLLAAAIVGGYLRRAEAVNAVIFYGLTANVALHVLAELTTGGEKVAGRGLWTLVYNVAALAPNLWMLWEFSGFGPERLAVWIRQAEIAAVARRAWSLTMTGIGRN